ncbi:DMT family transporter [Spelaeicoccus albus]|uniref:Transporter family-2 protein n=1 Tax=Spelaeicoccus albus TaxID=1280376 RepID=A0A7Z0D4N4_9MICO|nr:DMT family transporter [Spelaeicoccus albus]NYI68801.1 transporter family-2 protein [Spelaeicoccus albus]
MTHKPIEKVPNEDIAAEVQPEVGELTRNASRGKITATVLLTVATIFAGMLGPMQSAVNGQLGSYLGDGHAAAIVSFGAGLVLMFIIIAPRTKTRRAFLALPRHLANGTIPWWNFFAGLCGAVIVLSEGITVGALGVATFQTALISGMVVSGVLCDRLGIGVAFKQLLSTPRIVGAALAIIATILVVAPGYETPHVLALAILPFIAGLLAGWQPAGNSEVGRISDSMLVSITWNFLIGFVFLVVAFLLRAATSNVEFRLPDVWWLYLGGPLGLLSIALMALLVRGLGLLLLGLASTAGQLVGSIGIDGLIPAFGATIHMVTIVGTIVALIAAGIAMTPSRKIPKTPVGRAQ